MAAAMAAATTAAMTAATTAATAAAAMTAAITAAATAMLSIRFHYNKWIRSHWCSNCSGTASKWVPILFCAAAATES